MGKKISFGLAIIFGFLLLIGVIWRLYVTILPKTVSDGEYTMRSPFFYSGGNFSGEDTWGFRLKKNNGAIVFIDEKGMVALGYFTRLPDLPPTVSDTVLFDIDVYRTYDNKFEFSSSSLRGALYYRVDGEYTLPFYGQVLVQDCQDPNSYRPLMSVRFKTQEEVTEVMRILSSLQCKRRSQ